MPLSSFLAPSALAKPGVCTSSTRPASPYEGQVIYETDTDKLLFWNGSTWIENPSANIVDAKGDLIAGTAADTVARLAVGANGKVLEAASGETTGLKWGGTLGLEFVSSGTFNDVGSFDVTGFSSTYDFYDLFFQAKAHSTAAEITAQLRSGATARTTNYYGASYSNSYLGTAGSYSTRNNGSNISITQVVNSVSSVTRISIHGIDNTEFVMNLQTYDTNVSAAVFGGYSNYAATNSFDTIRFSGTNNITGYWNLMGVRKA